MAFDTSFKTVKVGYTQSKGFIEKDVNGNFSGYNYEYLQAISAYTGWKYEFIEAPFAECEQMLATGEIDLMGVVSKMAGKPDLYNYSNIQIGLDEFRFIVKGDDTRFDYNDFEKFNGIKIGYIKDTFPKSMLNAYMSENNFSADFIPCSDLISLQNAFNEKKIDVLLVTKMHPITNYRVISNFYSFPYYFVVTKKQPKLLKDLDAALSFIYRFNPDFNSYLLNKFFPENDSVAPIFSKEEKEFVKQSQIVTFVYFDRPPIEFTDEKGNFTGVIRDVMDHVESETGISFSYIPYSLAKKTGLWDSDQSFIFITSYDSTWADKKSLVLIPPFLRIPVVEINNSGKSNRALAALPEGLPVPQEIALSVEPEEIVFYPSVKDCFMALRKGTANFSYLNMYVSDFYLRQAPYRFLEFSNVSNFTENLCIAFNNLKDIRLYSVLEKSLDAISDSELSDIVAIHTKGIDTADFSDIFYSYPFRMAVIFIICCAIVISMLFINIYTVDKQNRRLKYSSEYDDFTGLWNKKTFFLKTREMMDKNPNQKYILVITDIEHFKVINDQFGIKVGDDLLQYIASDIKNYRTKSKGSFGYLEADHFVCCFLQEEINIKDFVQRVTDYLKDFRLDFEIVPYFGVYLVDSTNIDVDVSLMCDRARLALRTVKGSYFRRYAFFDSVLWKRMVDEQSIISEMNNALEKGEFVIYLQPQYNHVSGGLYGAEALVRWEHPTKGIVKPDDFIQVFEKNGFITKLDEYVWEKSCAMIRSWIDKEIRPVPIAVNLSRIDIYNPNLVETLQGLVTKYCIPHGYLKLEITESAYVENPNQLIETVKNLQKMHFIVEMDDFGSGYSSLNTLKDVPVDILKLDLKFLTGKENADRGGNILNSVIRMAKWLDLPVIAEGVETLAQADYLKSIGCNFVQGYLYSPPMPVRDFEKLLVKSDCEIDTSFEKMVDFLNINDFWNPEAQSSLLFNSLTGSACVFEYQNENLEVLRANDKFFLELETTRDSFERKRLQILNSLNKNDMIKFKSMIQDAISTEKETESVTRWFISNNDSEVNLRICVKLMAKNDTRFLLFAQIENISKLISIMH